MATLTTNLREFLIDVIQSDFPMTKFFSEAFYEEFFYFFDTNYENPTEEEQTRVKTICKIEDDELIKEVWIRAVSNHYESTYMAEYHDAIIDEIEKAVRHSFSKLPVFFGEELEEAGVDLSELPEFKVKFDWEQDQFIIEGDLNVLEIILIEVMRGIGWYYESLEEFIDCNGSDQAKRLRGHLQYLGEIESVYGTVHNFFTTSDLCELDRYGCFGDCDVTDQELLDAMSV